MAANTHPAALPARQCQSVPLAASTALFCAAVLPNGNAADLQTLTAALHAVLQLVLQPGSCKQQPAALEGLMQMVCYARRHVPGFEHGSRVTPLLLTGRCTRITHG